MFSTLTADNALARHIRCIRALAEHAYAVHVIRRGIRPDATDDERYQAAEAWFELPNEVKEALWMAPRDGGPWTTAERAALKDSEFRRLWYGE